MNITLNLTVDEVNKVLQSLGSKPFVEVSELIVKIKQQGDAQIVKQEFSVLDEAHAQQSDR